MCLVGHSARAGTGLAAHPPPLTPLQGSYRLRRDSAFGDDTALGSNDRNSEVVEAQQLGIGIHVERSHSVAGMQEKSFCVSTEVTAAAGDQLDFHMKDPTGSAP